MTAPDPLARLRQSPAVREAREKLAAYDEAAESLGPVDHAEWSARLANSLTDLLALVDDITGRPS
jgi:hypothetical protein